MPRVVDPTEADLQAAFALLHRADWPQDLHTLRMAATRMKLVQAAAREIANGGRPAHADLDGPITNPLPARPEAPPLRGWPKKPTGLCMQGPDLKRLAAGDRDD